MIPNAITADQAAKLVAEARDVMDRVSKGGEGIIRHHVSDNDGKMIPSPIGRVLATFESGK